MAGLSGVVVRISYISQPGASIEEYTITLGTRTLSIFIFKINFDIVLLKSRGTEKCSLVKVLVQLR